MPPITSLFIDGVLPVIPGMKTLDDFNVTNWFLGLPASDATPKAGFYFGAAVTDIAYNSFNANEPATVNGTLSNASGFITVNNTNFLDTHQKAPLATTICGVMKREATGSLNIHAIADFSGAASAAFGFTVGFAASGTQLFMAGQNIGVANPTYAYAAFPASVPVDANFAFVASITNGAVAVDVYDPSTDTVISATNTSITGTRVAGTKNILIGTKTDNNSNNANKRIKSALIMEGLMTAAQKKDVMKYLIAMA